MIIGYARVSTDDQKLEAQTDALTEAGAERVFADKITGSARSRPQLNQMLDQLGVDSGRGQDCSIRNTWNGVPVEPIGVSDW
jgi:predicted site-specific integrase-resolvase